MAEIDVTVVIPCYNTERFLDQCMTSIEANDRCALEILAVNDGSKDRSLEIMKAHAAKDPRVRVIDKPNQGYGASVNRGFSEARGTYLAIVEPDDYLVPHMYDDLIDFVNGFGLTTPPDLVKSSYWRIWMPTTPQERRYHCSYYGRIKPASQPFTLKDCPRLVQHHPSIWSAIYRRGFIEDNGIRFKEIPGAGWVDNPFLFETMCQAKTIVYTDTPYYCYREDLPGSSSAMRVASLSFERWNDMADVCDRLHVNDFGIRRSLATIGFRYVGAAIGEGALDDEKLSGLIRGVFSRMDGEVIASLANVSPSLRRLAFEMTGRPCPKLSGWGYFKALVSEFFYSWRSNGFSFAWSRVGVYFRRQAAQRGVGDPTSTHSASI